MQGFFQRFIALYRPIINKLNDILREYELSYSLWQVIFYIKKFGPSTLIDISNYYHVEKPSITRRVQRLEKMSILKGIPGKDKREKILQLTDVGDEIYEICRQKIAELEFNMMKGISKNDQLTAFQILPKIKENIIEGDKNE